VVFIYSDRPSYTRRKHIVLSVRGQGPCRANLHKWGLAQSPSCDCGQRQTMNHIVDTCPLTTFEGGLNLYITKPMMTQSYGWNLQRLQHSRNSNKWELCGRSYAPCVVYLLVTSVTGAVLKLMNRSRCAVCDVDGLKWVQGTVPYSRWGPHSPGRCRPLIWGWRRGIAVSEVRQ